MRDTAKNMDKLTPENITVKQISSEEILCNVKSNVLGRGGFGIVLLGHHRILGQVAVKCKHLRESNKGVKESNNEILREIKMMILARHKHVVDVHGVIDEEKFIGLVMEHMPAGSFYDFIFNKKLPSLPMPLLLRMNYESSDGITYLHKLLKDRRIAHGDLKPQNILLTADLHCKVADFGGAAFSQNTFLDEGIADQSGEGAQCTISFTAPERMDPNCKRLTTSMDVYSFGVILFMSVARKYPEFPRIVMKVLKSENPFEDDLTRIKGRSEGNSEDKKNLDSLESIMAMCVDKNPSKRLSMIEVRDQLQQQLKSIKLTTIAQQVANVLAHIDVRDDGLQENACKQINQVISRNNYLEELEHSGNPSSEDEEVVFEESESKLTLIEQTEEKQNTDSGYESIKLKKQEINDFLTQKLVDNAIVKCDELLSLVKSTLLSQEKALCLGYDIIKLVDVMLENKLFTRLVNFLESVSYLHIWIENPPDKLELLQQYIDKAADCVMQYTPSDKLKQTICRQLITYMDHVLDVITLTSCADKKLVVKTEAARAKCLGLCEKELKNVDKAIVINVQTISKLKAVFGHDRVKLSVYGSCCHNLATIYESKGQYKEALRYYLKSHFAHRVTEDYKDESKWRRSQFLNLWGICNMQKKNPSFHKKKVKEIFRYLQDQYLTGFSHFVNSLMVLRFAVILGRPDEQVKLLCDNVVSMTTSISPPSDQCYDICYQAERVVESLFLVKRDEAAFSLMHCVIRWWKYIHIPSQRCQIASDMADIISDRITSSSSSFSSQLASVSSDFILICEELIESLVMINATPRAVINQRPL
ncbi:unnamed protein product [Clavelina lepadiformis]|uniref:Protein kinase domain-containing protein n=1 Tax=Clavelina lepadiformis TaxID=159417 RepID=A0ABP0GS48_CLALP